MNFDTMFEYLLVAAMVVLSVLVLAAILRSVKGPIMADRIIAINMIGTITIALIAILTVFLGEDYLADICLVYALISFLAVVVLTKIFTGFYREERGKRESVNHNRKAAAGEEK